MSVELSFTGAQANRLWDVAAKLVNEPAHHGSFTLCPKTKTIQCPDETARSRFEQLVASTLQQERRNKPRKKVSRYHRL